MAKILIVDDSALSRAIVAKALKEGGHEVVQATNGKEGIAAFEREPFDCVVTDLLMPVLDGHQLLTHVRSIDRHLPVVVLTADIQASTQTICQELAVSGFVNKPVKAETLRACIEKALSRAQGAPTCI